MHDNFKGGITASTSSSCTSQSKRWKRNFMILEYLVSDDREGSLLLSACFSPYSSFLSKQDTFLPLWLPSIITCSFKQRITCCQTMIESKEHWKMKVIDCILDANFLLCFSYRVWWWFSLLFSRFICLSCLAFCTFLEDERNFKKNLFVRRLFQNYFFQFWEENLLLEFLRNVDQIVSNLMMVISDHIWWWWSCRRSE